MNASKNIIDREPIVVLFMIIALLVAGTRVQAAPPPPEGTPCRGNSVNDIMVRVGPLCVDKYEARPAPAPRSRNRSHATRQRSPRMAIGLNRYTQHRSKASHRRPS